MKPVLEEALMGFIDFATVVKSKLSDVQNLLATIRGDEDGDGTFEEAEDQELWGHAAIAWRPADPTDDGEVECIMLRRGEDRIGVATRDVRWQPDLEKGEVMVRAFGDDAATVLLKPDGTVVVTAAGDVLFGDDTAAKALALAEKVDARLSTIQSTFDAHTHAYNPGPGAAAPTATPITPIGSLASTQSTKVKATE